MFYLLFLLSLCFIVGLVGVAANPSPYYGAVGLVAGALGGSGVLVVLGGSFVGIILFLIYLGGMLVVFAYSVALAAEPYPETWVDYSVMVYAVGYGVLVLFGGWALVEFAGVGCGVEGIDGFGLFGVRGDFSGVGLLFLGGGLLLLLSGWGLMLTLFVVLELVRGRSRSGVRVP